ncbi:MAG TPA: hypothetical protein VMA32_06495, partial [Streptosporangiaceae bacterium]|nr:hypothetical protein [Streptosporangiaceae bacterium]
MTPPSTSQMAPVTQLVAGDSRKGDDVGHVPDGAGPAERVQCVEAVQCPRQLSSAHVGPAICARMSS